MYQISKNFERMFSGCSSISNIDGLNNWHVSKANNFKRMFSGCSLNGLKNWNASNAKISKILRVCSFYANLCQM